MDDRSRGGAPASGGHEVERKWAGRPRGAASFRSAFGGAPPPGRLVGGFDVHSGERARGAERGGGNGAPTLCGRIQLFAVVPAGHHRFATGPDRAASRPVVRCFWSGWRSGNQTACNRPRCAAQPGPAFRGRALCFGALWRAISSRMRRRVLPPRARSLGLVARVRFGALGPLEKNKRPTGRGRNATAGARAFSKHARPGTHPRRFHGLGSIRPRALFGRKPEARFVRMGEWTIGPASLGGGRGRTPKRDDHRECP